MPNIFTDSDVCELGVTFMAYEIVEEVVKFAGDLSRYLNNDIAKYKTYKRVVYSKV